MPPRNFINAWAALFLALAVTCQTSLAQADSASGLSGGLEYKKDVRPLLEKYCWDCHADGVAKGDVALDKQEDAAAIFANRKLWTSVHFNIENWIMPPAKEDIQPTAAEREIMARYLDAAMNPYDPAKPDPGRVTIRRLNRVEYNNTVRDLLDVDLRPADEFPEDDTGYGFDTIGDVLALPPILMERYLSAAERVLDAAIPTVLAGPTKRLFRYKDLRGDGDRGNDGRVLSDEGVTGAEYEFLSDGEYILRARVYGEQAGPDPVKIQLKHEGTVLKETEITAVRGKAVIVETKFQVKKGKSKIGIAFINDFFDDKAAPGKKDRNLVVQGLEIEGPTDAKNQQEKKMARIFSPGEKLGETEVGARAILQNFTNRAFRRAATPGEVDRLLKLFLLAKAKGEDFRSSLKLAMKAVMVSPYFLYRIEWQPEPNNPGMVVDINEFALASRLSYFLWSSMPDDELLSMAFRNELRKNLKPQVLRMLADPKAGALAQNFSGQWLELRTLAVVKPDKQLFPFFNDELRREMVRETEEFFLNLVKENKSVLEFISANYSYINENLARHYRIPGVSGSHFRRVEFPKGSPRRGILTQASILTLTSDPNRTAPVKRGKWILENMLDTPPPPPPPNVPPLAEGSAAELTGTVRQRVEQHRNNPACSGCHSLLDPIGFGFENYDALGRWRDQDGGRPVDSAGILTTGQKFTNALELSEIILTDKKENFVRGMIKKMMTYALGRGLEAYDKPAIEAILARMRQDNYSAHALLFGLIESVPFQKRRGDAAQPKAK